MTTVEINGRIWSLGDPIGDRGGFGQVFEAVDKERTPAAIKQVPKTPGAKRELLFEDLAGMPNVVPVLGWVETSDSYLLLMPRAEVSLRGYLQTNSLNPEQAVQILTDVATALDALADRERPVVHRDLKPANILFLDGKWCLCDFGVARYAEAATSLNTQKYSMTPAYAAPEQWRGETATPATDIYSFGVVAYELTQGKVPFDGPDYRSAHLNAEPPELTGVPPALASLIVECLYKASGARPTAANIVARLGSSLRPASAAAEQLRRVNQVVVTKLAAEQAAISAAKNEAERRADLAATGLRAFEGLYRSLSDFVLEHAPSCRIEPVGGLLIALADGQLFLQQPENTKVGALLHERIASPLDAILHTRITVAQNAAGYRGRSHSLWYCDAHELGVYRWYEMAFMPAIMLSTNEMMPYNLDPSRDSALAFGFGGGDHKLARQPTSVDQGEEAAFVERWMGLLAAASERALTFPHALPEASGGHVRPVATL